MSKSNQIEPSPSKSHESPQSQEPEHCSQVIKNCAYQPATTSRDLSFFPLWSLSWKQGWFVPPLTHWGASSRIMWTKFLVLGNSSSYFSLQTRHQPYEWLVASANGRDRYLRHSSKICQSHELSCSGPGILCVNPCLTNMGKNWSRRRREAWVTNKCSGN